MLIDSAECAPDKYSTIDVGRPGGMQIVRCILKKDAGKTGAVVNRDDWRKFGVTQSFILSDENVVPCKKRSAATLCPINERGANDIKSIESKFGQIVKHGDLYTVSMPPSAARRAK